MPSARAKTIDAAVLTSAIGIDGTIENRYRATRSRVNHFFAAVSTSTVVLNTGRSSRVCPAIVEGDPRLGPRIGPLAIGIARRVRAGRWAIDRDRKLREKAAGRGEDATPPVRRAPVTRRVLEGHERMLGSCSVDSRSQETNQEQSIANVRLSRRFR